MNWRLGALLGLAWAGGYVSVQALDADGSVLAETAGYQVRTRVPAWCAVLPRRLVMRLMAPRIGRDFDAALAISELEARTGRRHLHALPVRYEYHQGRG